MKRNSIAGKLYSFGREIPETKTDICSYISRIVGNVGLTILAIAIVGCIASIFGVILIGILEIILNLAGVGGWMFYLGSLGASGTIVLFFVTVAVLAILFFSGLSALAKVRPPKDGIVDLAYRRRKEKVCFIIEFED